jgi:Mg2+ and Co2+ transporter CorA
MGMASLVGLAVVAKILGSATSSLLKGAIALALIGLSLIPAAAAFQMFSGVSWDGLALAGVAIIGLSAAVAILGAIMLSGGGAAAILLGAIALAAIGAALIPAAAAMLIFSIAAEKLSSAMDEISEGLSTIIKAIGDSISKVIQTISSGVTQIIDSIQNLSNINGANLLLVAAGITAVGAALLSFSALSSIGSVMSSITSLFSEDPVEKLQRIADMGDDLYNSAQAIKSLSGVIANLQILNTIDGGNLIVAAAGITAFSVALLSFSALSGISSIMSSVMSIFSGDPIDNLERIANMSDGLTKSAMAVATLSSALTALAAALESITTDRIDRLKDINNVGNFIKPIIQSSVQENKKFVEYSDNEEKENFGNYQSPIKDVTKPFISMAKATVPFVATAKPMVPPAETTAQNILIKDNKSISESSVKSNTGDLIQPYMDKKTGTLDTSRMESLLKQLIDVVHAYSNRPQEVIIDRPAVNKLRGLIKAGNNNV